MTELGRVSLSPKVVEVGVKRSGARHSYPGGGRNVVDVAVVLEERVRIAILDYVLWLIVNR